MVDLTVRNVSQDVVDALRRRAAAHSRSVEAGHRELLYATLLGVDNDFASRAKALRQRLYSRADSTQTIRADRDRNHS